MTKYLPYLLVVLLAFSIGRFSQAQTQADMTQQAGDAFKAADDELNQVYQKLVKLQPDDIAKKKLVAAQRAWVAFRTAEGDFAADSNRGGTIESSVNMLKQETLTKERVTELKEYLKQANE